MCRHVLAVNCDFIELMRCAHVRQTGAEGTDRAVAICHARRQRHRRWHPEGLARMIFIFLLQFPLLVLLLVIPLDLFVLLLCFLPLWCVYFYCFLLLFCLFFFILILLFFFAVLFSSDSSCSSCSCSCSCSCASYVTY